MPIDKSTYTPKGILRANLRACMAMKSGPTSQLGLAKKSGVSQATIGRILSDEGVDAQIETIDKIARAYGLQAWQMMIAGMDPTNPPVLQPVTKAERALYENLKKAARDYADHDKE